MIKLSRSWTWAAHVWFDSSQEAEFFSNLQLWQYVNLHFFDPQTSVVPLWKDIDPVIKLFSAQEFGSILDVHFVLTKRSYLQRVYLVSKWFNNFLSECTWSLNFFYWIKKHPNLLISEYNTFASSFKSFNFSRHYLF